DRSPSNPLNAPKIPESTDTGYYITARRECKGDMTSNFCPNGQTLTEPALLQPALDLPLCVPLGDVRPLVVLLFPFGQGELNLGKAVAKVDIQRDQGVSLLPGQADQLADLLLVEKQLSRPRRIGVETVPLFVGADVHVQEIHFPVLDPGEAVPQVDPPLANRLDFRPGEHDAGLVGFFDVII